MKLLTLSPDQIRPPVVGARDMFDEVQLNELAQDIRARGLLAPLVVSPDGDAWRLVAGSRRLAACKLLGLVEIPCIERAGDEEGQVSDMLAENLQRADLNPLEEGRVFAIFQESTGKSVFEIASLIHKGPQYVGNRLRLWHAPDDLRQAVASGQINQSVALELERCEHEGDRKFLLSHAISGGATAMLARQWVTRQAQDRAAMPAGTPTSPAQLEAVVTEPFMAVCEWHRGPVPANAMLAITVCQPCFQELQEVRAHADALDRAAKPDV